MLLHPILLQLIVGVCLHELIAVKALPTQPGIERKWWSQLNVPWIDIAPDEWEHWKSCPGYDQNDEVFKEDLTEILSLTSRDRQNELSSKGRNNQGIYVVGHNVEFPGNEVIVKRVDLNRRSASCEVVALKELTQLQQDERAEPKPWSDQPVLFIKSGYVTDSLGHKWGVIVMHKQAGQQLPQMPQWAGPPEVKRQMMNVVYERTFRKAYDLVEKKGLVHVDFSPTNILVDEAGCYLIDFGAPSVYRVKGTKPTEEEFERWYRIRWGFLWNSLVSGI
ncbi:hypothetical protein F5050DRAFT_1713672 [Lentinula boryana]|uniref:non-specific serine/threonine protein kinase n=1 Tax=Lentinula boryana TaxID=40481 RepID=A0ABQ8Q7D9_9AGAR|nr:hypothetical protein F5050DRAFT_1713672 [Lentinula boryana]